MLSNIFIGFAYISIFNGILTAPSPTVKEYNIYSGMNSESNSLGPLYDIPPRIGKRQFDIGSLSNKFPIPMIDDKLNYVQRGRRFFIHSQGKISRDSDFRAPPRLGKRQFGVVLLSSNEAKHDNVDLHKFHNLEQRGRFAGESQDQELLDQLYNVPSR